MNKANKPMRLLALFKIIVSCVKDCADGLSQE